MAPELKRLSDEELEILNKAPILVCILIAGADGQIDRNEIKEAIETATKKAKGKSSLQTYYQEISMDFEDKLKVLLQNYSSNAEERGDQISHELSGLNSLFSKIEGSLAQDIYDSLKNMALKIAKSSGGLFGLKSIGPEEAKYIDLNMILPPTASH